jgi:hypothetical protein
MKGLIETMSAVVKIAKELVANPFAGMVSILLFSEFVWGFFFIKQMEANNLLEAALRKCEADKLEIARTSFDTSIDQLGKLMEIKSQSEKKLMQIDTVFTTVQKTKK